MPWYAEILLVAVLLYLWESTLWLPLGGVALRRTRAGRWTVLCPEAWFSTRAAGLVPLLPIPPDAGLAPCQEPPLAIGDDGRLLGRIAGGWRRLERLDWDALKPAQHHLHAGGARLRISSPRCLETLRRLRRRGFSLEDAVIRNWRLALSPTRAAREWRKWRMVSAPLRWLCPTLAAGCFIGVPLAYISLGSGPALWLAAVLWGLMAAIAARLWRLAGRAYPGAGPELRMDAVLALLVPFHAMRAHEIAAVHAMGATHPVAMMLATRDLENPWLARHVRGFLHPARDHEAIAAFILPHLDRAISRAGGSLRDLDRVPDTRHDPQAERYCPRCHALYQQHIGSCADCGLELRATGDHANRTQ